VVGGGWASAASPPRPIGGGFSGVGLALRAHSIPSAASCSTSTSRPTSGWCGLAALVRSLRSLTRSLAHYSQVLFEESEEVWGGGVGTLGLGVVKGTVGRFDSGSIQVPHIGWNTVRQRRKSGLLGGLGAGDRMYYVHSYRATVEAGNADDVLATCAYGGEFVAAVNRGGIYATQFHPEKSGRLGLGVIDNFLSGREWEEGRGEERPERTTEDDDSNMGLSKRVIACLDVRANDNGDLVVTKGDQYDVRESDGEGEGEGGNAVRNLGKPVELARRYFEEGADEVTFLNITGFRDFPLGDLPMLEVLKQASENVFVPLTVGGGIRYE